MFIVVMSSSRAFQLGSARDLFSSARNFFSARISENRPFFANFFFFHYFPCIFTLFLVFFVVNNTFSYYKMNDFWVEKFLTPRKKKLELKKLYIQKNPAWFQLEN